MININKNSYLIPFSSNSIESLELKYEKSILNFKNKLKFKKFVKKQIIENSKNKETNFRRVVIASNWNEFIDKSNHYNSLNDTSKLEYPPIRIFVYSGQGSQYNKMAKSLYENVKSFKNDIDKLDFKFSKYCGYSIINKLRSIDDNDNLSIHDTILAQLSTEIIMVSLFNLYKLWGVEPTINVGLSLGDMVVAYCSKMISLNSFIYLSYERARLQSLTDGMGKILAINLSSDKFLELYGCKYPDVEIASYTSPSTTSIAGNEIDIIEIYNHAKSNGILCTIMGTRSSFHGKSQDSIKNDILNLKIKSSTPIVTTFSTVTKNQFDNSNTKFNSNYLFDNIRIPVYFKQTFKNIYKYIELNNLGNNITFIEIAPHRTFIKHLKEMHDIESSSSSSSSSCYFSKDKIQIHSPLDKNLNDFNEFQKTISKLYCEGNNVNFNNQLLNQ